MSDAEKMHTATDEEIAEVKRRIRVLQEEQIAALGANDLTTYRRAASAYADLSGWVYCIETRGEARQSFRQAMKAADEKRVFA